MKDRLAEDWVALWQSELTAMAADRELRETTSALVALWANAANATLAALRAAHEHAPGTTSHAQPPGATPAAAASQPGMDEVGQLHRRIAELEQRLASLERGHPAPPA